MTTPRFTHKELTGYLWFGIILAAVGFIATLLIPPGTTTSPLWFGYDTMDYWFGYKVCGLASAIMAIIVGVAWTAIVALHLFTDFFSLEKKATAEEFTVSVIVLTIVVLFLAVWLSNKVPSLVERPIIRNEDAQVPGDPAIFTQNMRTLVKDAIVLGGLALASFPTIRFFKQ